MTEKQLKKLIKEEIEKELIKETGTLDMFLKSRGSALGHPKEAAQKLIPLKHTILKVIKNRMPEALMLAADTSKSVTQTFFDELIRELQKLKQQFYNSTYKSDYNIKI